MADRHDPPGQPGVWADLAAAGERLRALLDQSRELRNLNQPRLRPPLHVVVDTTRKGG